MTIRRMLPAALGAFAVSATAAILVILIILARSFADRVSSPVRITAIIAAALEALVLIALFCLSYSYFWTVPRSPRLGSFTGIWFGGGLFLCVVGAAVSVASLICLTRASSQLPSTTILGSSASGFMVGASVALGLAFAAQLMFSVARFISSRVQERGGRSPSGAECRSQMSQRQVKSIPYHTTSPQPTKTRKIPSLDLRSPPGSSHSATQTWGSSIRSSLSDAIRPISSKTRLLPGRQHSFRRSGSFDHPGAAEQQLQSGTMVDGFDTWDTSAVDPQNRQTVLESSSPPLAGRFLETIPASPTASRSPSPGTPFDLDPPRRARRRSRSYSPAASSTRTTRSQGAASITQQTESHIHPLFRSDSPTPPAITTPGTVVIAAPNAGQIISDRQSIRTLVRMRSGSLPPVPSPLSRQGSFDSFRRGRTESTSPELREEDEENTDLTTGRTLKREVTASPSPTVEEEPEVRKMTPPIPDWVMGAGTRTSLVGYQSRKLKILDEETSQQATTQ